MNWIDPWGLSASEKKQLQYEDLLTYAATFKISGYAKHPGMPNSSGQNLYLNKPQDACFLRCHFEAQILKEAGFTPNYVLLKFIDRSMFNYHIAPAVEINQNVYIVDPVYGGDFGVTKFTNWAAQFPAHTVKYREGVQNGTLISNIKLWQNYYVASNISQNTPIPDINDFAKRWLDAYGKTGDIEKSMYEAIK